MSSSRLMRIRSIRSAVRLTEMARVLLKYGFDGLVEVLGLPGGGLIRRMTHVGHNISIWKRIRLALEELGPTYIKFGQVLSFRPDLIPPELHDELIHLREDVYREDFEDVRAIVEESLGLPLSQLFHEFSETPVATGSLAQVHRAKLAADGTEVAVKVQRPDIARVIASDLDILGYVAEKLDAHIESLQIYDVPGVVREIKKFLSRELDFLNEVNNIETFDRNFERDDRVFAPRPYPDYCTDRVLVMEFVRGHKLDDVDLPVEVRDELAETGLEVMLKQVVIDGFFHADPHSGNVRIVKNTSDDGPPYRLCFLDWGMVGRLTTQMRRELISYVQALADSDTKKLMRQIIRMSQSAPPLLDETSFENDLLFPLSKMQRGHLASQDIGSFFMEIIDLCRTYGLNLRAEYVYMIRAVAATEATGRELSPTFDIMGGVGRVARKYRLSGALSFFSERIVLEKIEEAFTLGVELPARSTRFLDVMEAGQLELGMRLGGLAPLTHSLRMLANRLAVALIVASLVIGSSLIIAAEVGPFFMGYPLLGVVGFSVSFVLGFILVINILFMKK